MRIFGQHDQPTIAQFQRVRESADALGRTPPEVRETLTTIADEIADSVSFGMGRRNRSDDAPVDHPLFGDAAWSAVPAAQRKD